MSPGVKHCTTYSTAPIADPRPLQDIKEAADIIAGSWYNQDASLAVVIGNAIKDHSSRIISMHYTKRIVCLANSGYPLKPGQLGVGHVP